MISKKKYFDDFFETVKKHDNPIAMVKRWKRCVRDLEKGAELIPSYYKVKGKYRRVTRKEEISMFRDWIKEFQYRIINKKI